MKYKLIIVCDNWLMWKDVKTQWMITILHSSMEYLKSQDYFRFYTPTLINMHTSSTNDEFVVPEGAFHQEAIYP